MNSKHIWIVFKKEVKDIFRDKRTWIASVLIPMLIFPLLFFFMNIGVSKMEKNLQNDISVFIETNGQNADIVEYLKGGVGLKVINIDNPYEALEKGDIKAIIQIGENFQDKISEKVPGNIKIIFDEVSNESSMATSIVEGIINRYSDEVRLERLADIGVDPTILQPTIINREAYIPEGQESKGDSTALMMITFMLPFFLMLYPVVGGMPAAIDLGSGEKERMSLEPLLASGADRLSILTGKYLTVLLAAILGTITSLIGVVAAAKIAPNIMPLEVKISPLSMLILVTTSLFIAMMLSGLMLSISVFAKSYKEAGTYLSPITIVLMVPAYLTMFMDIRTLPNGMFFIPLLNAVLLMKEVLVDIINPLHIVATFGISIVLVVASLQFMKYMFNKESVIFRS